MQPNVLKKRGQEKGGGVPTQPPSREPQKGGWECCSTADRRSTTPPQLPQEDKQHAVGPKQSRASRQARSKCLRAKYRVAVGRAEKEKTEQRQRGEKGEETEEKGEGEREQREKKKKEKEQEEREEGGGGEDRGREEEEEKERRGGKNTHTPTHWHSTHTRSFKLKAGAVKAPPKGEN